MGGWETDGRKKVKDSKDESFEEKYSVVAETIWGQKSKVAEKKRNENSLAQIAAVEENENSGNNNKSCVQGRSRRMA